MKSLYLADLKNLSAETIVDDIVDAYEVDVDLLSGVDVLVAYQSCGNYGCDSTSYFLISKGGQLFGVHGAHDSCYGFEGQWDPKPVTERYLLSDNWHMSIGYFDDQAEQNVAAVRDFIRELFCAPENREPC